MTNLPDLCIDIIKYVSSSIINAKNADSDIIEAFNELYFPVFSNSSVQKLRDDLRAGKNLTDVFYSHNFVFSFRPDFLRSLIIVIQKSGTINHEYSSAILYSFISWVLLIENGRFDDFLSVIQSSLALLLNSPDQICIKLGIISINYTIIKIINSNNTSIDPSVIDIAFMSFAHSKDLLSSIDLIIDLGIKVFNTYSIEIRNIYLKSFTQYLFPFKQSYNSIRFANLLSILLHSMDTFNRMNIEFIINILPHIKSMDLFDVSKALSTMVFSLSKSIIFEFTNVDDLIPITIIPRDVNFGNNKIILSDYNYQSNQSQYFETQSIESHIPLSILMFLEEISQIIISKDGLSNSFVLCSSSIFPFQEDKIIQLKSSLALFYVFIKLFKSVSDPYPIEILCLSTILDPLFSGFSLDPQSKIFGSLRKSIALFATKNSSISFRKVLSSIEHYPTLVSEMVLRFSTIDIASFFEDTDSIYCLEYLIYLLFLYQQAETSTSIEKVAVSNTRSALFGFLDQFLMSTKCTQSLSLHNAFVEFFPYFYFEPSLCIYTRSVIERVSCSSNIEQNDFFFHSIIIISEPLFDTLGNKSMINSCNTYLEMCLFLINKFSSKAEQISSIIENICPKLPLLQRTTESRLLLMNLISFCTLISPYHLLTNSEIGGIESSLHQHYGPEPDDNLYFSLFKLIIGPEDMRNAQQVIFKQPRVLRLLIGAYRYSSKLERTLSFIADCCQKSIQNSILSSSGGLDIYLLDLLNQWRNDEDISLRTVAATVSLYMILSKTYSSVTSVRQFISLFSLIEGKWLPRFHPIVLAAFSKMINEANKVPIFKFPISNDKGIEITGIDSSKFASGLILYMWYLSDSIISTKGSFIISFIDSKNSFIQILVENSTIFFQYLNGKEIIRETTNLIIPNNQWFLLEFAIFPKNQSYSIFISIHDVNKHESQIPISALLLSSIKYVTTKCSCNTASLPIAYLGPICILPLNDQKKISDILAYTLYHTSQNIIPSLYLNPTEMNGSVIFSEPRKSSSIVISQKFEESNIYFSFVDIFLNQCGVDLLLPLFAQWGLCFRDGSESPNIIEHSLQLFEGAIKCRLDIQCDFHDANGIIILSHLLFSTNPVLITYKLYNRLFSIFCCLNHHDSKLQFLKHILLNPSIWTKSDQKSHLEISNHWENVISLDYASLLIECFSFTYFLNIISVYYWIMPDETDKSRMKCRFRGDQLCLSNIRKAVFGVAYSFSLMRFTQDDFLVFISTIITCNDFDHLFDLLILLKRMISTLSFNEDVLSSFEIIFLLQYLFNIKNDKIVIAIISVLIESHKFHLIKSISLQDHIDLIHHQLGSSFIRESLFEKMVMKTGNDCHCIFPITFWMALNIGENAINMVLTSIRPSKSIASNDFWALWPIFASYLFSNEYQTRIIQFLLACDPDSYRTIITTIITIGIGIHKDYHSLLRILFFEYIKGYPDNILRSFGDFLGCVFDSFFFKWNKDIYDTIINTNNKSSRKPIPLQSNHHLDSRSHDFVSRKKKSKILKSKNSRHSLSNIEQNANLYSPEMAEITLSRLITNSNSPNGKSKGKRISLLKLEDSVLVDTPSVSTRTQSESFMPIDLDYQLKSIDLSSCNPSFGMFFDDQANWIDSDIIIEIIRLFMAGNDRQHVSSILFLYSFLIRSGKKEIPDLLSAIDLNSLNNHDLLCFFNRSKIAVSKINHLNMPLGECENCSIEFLNSYCSELINSIDNRPLQLYEKLIERNKNNSNNAQSLLEKVQNGIISLSPNSLADYLDNMHSDQENFRKIWLRFWKCMTIHHAPWFKSLPSSHKTDLHYKRDSILCSYGYPAKFKKNFHYNNHMQESLIRDTGDPTTAMEQYEQFRILLEKEYSINTPTKLFEVVEDKEQQIKKVESSTSTCIIELACELIRVKGHSQGIFTLLSDTILLSFSDGKTTIIRLNEIKGLLLRTHLHHQSAIEIFSISNRSYFINFPNVNSLPILKCFKGLNLPKIQIYQNILFKPFFESQNLTDQWIHRKISTFHYILMLNTLSGRSFNNPSQYPIFPWVISQYDTPVAQLQSKMFYRDFSKPIGALNESRMKELIEKCKSFKEMNLDPYLYSSGPVCPLSLFLWLVRIEPFTTLHVDIQGGRFDHPGRLFNSINNAFLLCTTTQNDFRELIPEFFFMPEFLVNSNDFNLGIFNGNKIDDVVLPPWAQSNHHFIYINRKALESEIASLSINKWFDLIWGYKQQGIAAEEANNVYMKEMYPSIWTKDNLENKELRANIEAILCHVGQIPPQLFSEPHPNRIIYTISPPLIPQPVLIKGNPQYSISHTSFIQSLKKIIIIDIDITGSIVTSSINIGQIISALSGKSMKGRSRSTTVTSGNQISTNNKRSSRHSNSDRAFIDYSDITSYIDVSRSSKPIKKYPYDSKDTKTKYFYHYIDEQHHLICKLYGNDIYLIKNGTDTPLSIIHQRNTISSFDIDQDTLVVANSEAVLSIYSISEPSQHRFIIPTFSSIIYCLAVSHSFNTIVCGTTDGTLLFCSLKNGQITGVVNLNGSKPKSIIITPSWGFVLIELKTVIQGAITSSIALYSINGEKINQKAIENPISCWKAYSDEKGFDHVVMVDCQSVFYFFEAFFLNYYKQSYRTSSKVAHINYFREESTVIALTELGDVILVPYITESV